MLSPLLLYSLPFRVQWLLLGIDVQQNKPLLTRQRYRANSVQIAAGA
jgi:hypothetical protein